MKKLSTLINEAMDLHEQAREKLSEMLSLCTQEEGCEKITEAIDSSATPLVNAFNSLEDILSAVEDVEVE